MFYSKLHETSHKFTRTNNSNKPFEKSKFPIRLLLNHNNMSTRHSRNSSGSISTSNRSGDSSLRSRISYAPLLDDQLANWWESTVLGNPSASNDTQEDLLGWEFTSDEPDNNSRSKRESTSNHEQ